MFADNQCSFTGSNDILNISGLCCEPLWSEDTRSYCLSRIGSQHFYCCASLIVTSWFNAEGQWGFSVIIHFHLSLLFVPWNTRTVCLYSRCFKNSCQHLLTVVPLLSFSQLRTNGMCSPFTCFHSNLLPFKFSIICIIIFVCEAPDGEQILQNY